MINEDGQQPLLSETTKIATVRNDKLDLRMEQMPADLKKTLNYKPEIVSKVVNYRFHTIRKYGYYLHRVDKIPPNELWARRTDRPVDICIPVPVYEGEHEKKWYWRAQDGLAKLVGKSYVPCYEVIDVSEALC